MINWDTFIRLINSYHAISLNFIAMDDLIYFLFKDSLLAIDLSLTEHLQDLLGLPIPDST